ncbi:MAG: phosphotransferase family protein, partial [Congregibacter sp.]|nr:phosphotransferase family protein [Congregibacter sp.]
MSTQTLNIEALQTYLQDKLPGFSGRLRAEKFQGGQSNPTFLISDDSQQWVLRRKPPGELLASAHAVDREYRVLSALQHTDVPVAKTYLLCEDESVIGSMFYIMEYLEGRVFWNPELPEIASNEERSAIYSDM